MEPLHINRIDISQGGNSPIAINLNFKDLDLSGVSKSIVKRVVGFGADPKTSKFEVYATLPKISIVGKYKVNFLYCCLKFFATENGWNWNWFWLSR